MPLIQVKSSISKVESSKAQTLLKEISSKASDILGKPESYVMTSFEGGIPMTFGGTDGPTCYLEVKSVGTMSKEQTKKLSATFCEIISQQLKVPENRIYIEFNNSEGFMWGWNGSTF